MMCHPVIIIGMHRSGTTMLTRLLEQLGLFVGKKREANHEAAFFVDINLWLMSQCHGSWDNPQPIHYLLQNNNIRGQVVDYIARYRLGSPRTMQFLGIKNYVRYRTPGLLDIPWGWKSPLNTFTLPIWLELFPNAKIIHIYRHGVDVANSLRQRGRRSTRQSLLKKLYYRFPILHAVRPKSGEFIGVRCESLEGGLSLWEEYLAESRKHVETLRERALELKYESLLVSPEESLGVVSRFCNLSVNTSGLQSVAARVRKERAYAYRENPDLQAFAQSVPKRLGIYGY